MVRGGAGRCAVVFGGVGGGVCGDWWWVWGRNSAATLTARCVWGRACVRVCISPTGGGVPLRKASRNGRQAAGMFRGRRVPLVPIIPEVLAVVSKYMQNDLKC